MDRENLIKPIGIERLVNWAFEREKVAMMVGQDRGIFPILAQLQRTTVGYGERISGGGGATGYDIHPDASVVYEAWRLVMEVSAEGASLIRSYGESALRPDWIADGELRFEADIDPVTGLVKPARDANRNLVRESCRVKRVGKLPDIVRVARSEYRVWWAALHYLQELVREAAENQGGLVQWRLTRELPPKEPWMIMGPGNGLSCDKVA
ncbi:hypothetical protein ABIE64_003511 [Thalassospira sp. MBR-102]|jgi:hypothetical protein|uniref:hypothetical protein n=1 Tax=Thalassospira sp. MBR-102 TaxID=3156466 RepID=UPI00339249A1